jgi:hypothetical protein
MTVSVRPISVKLNKGTVEHVPVNVADRLGNLTDLSTTMPKFDLKKHDGTAVITDQAADTVVGAMTAYCLINTTTLDIGLYNLFLKFSLSPEFPVLGPFEIEVI